VFQIARVNTAFTYPSDVSIVEVTPSKYKFNILPNPNNGNFIINWENAEIAPDAKVWIESVYGEKVTTPAYNDRKQYCHFN
jgi:hypothetical protein